ncbi:GntR family transcriptional regulator [Aquamicrobium sp.]|uniref:GntR family transcriptional regulator n=1 Tax=Aquamicrobium sp. TaxID=1872579 RepID=UPI00349E613F
MLPSETEMAAQFGVNRHALREGLCLLEQNSLLKRELLAVDGTASPSWMLPDACSARCIWRTVHARTVETCGLAIGTISDRSSPTRYLPHILRYAHRHFAETLCNAQICQSARQLTLALRDMTRSYCR